MDGLSPFSNADLCVDSDRHLDDDTVQTVAGEFLIAEAQMPHPMIIGVYIVAFGVTSGLVFLLVSWLGAWRQPVASIAASVLSMIVLVLVVRMLPDPEVSIVRIDGGGEPRALPGKWQTIEGSVTPPEARVVVLVHEKDDNEWWVQDTIQRGNFGAWRAEINLGTENQGNGHHFQVVAIASMNPWFVDVLKGHWYRDGATVSRPPALPRSEMLTIWRSQ